MPSTESTLQSPAGPFRLPVGVSDFGKLIRRHYVFVDKSLMIREVIQDGAEVTLITRPRRFGKTLNLSMLQHFFSREVIGQQTAGLFDDLLISKDLDSMTHQGQYPVIFFTFKGIKEVNFELAKEKLRAAIAELYQGYPELIDSPHLAVEQKTKIANLRSERASLVELSNAIKNLTEYLYRHYQKPVLLLIDEYDTPIHTAYLNSYYKEMVDLMRGLLGEALKDNVYLYKAVVTGILRVSWESLFSGLNNLKVHTVLDKRYSRHFGFTEDEVTDLFKTVGLNHQATQAQGPIKTWYNGYQFGATTVYNPWSIISCLDEQGACRPYWINTSDNTLLKQLMARADGGFKQQMEALLQDHEIEQLVDPNIVFGDLDKSAMALWSLLLFSGYLAAAAPCYDAQGRVLCRLSVPNLEVLGLYQRHIEEWFSDTMGRENYGDFLNCLVTGKVEEFEARLAEYLRESASFFDTGQRHPEKFYHGLVLGLIAGLKETHLIYSNRESGFGRYDIALLPRKTSVVDQRLGILMEFKPAKDTEQLQDTARHALQQINTQHYQTKLEQHRIERILKIGLAFSGKQMAMAVAR